MDHTPNVFIMGEKEFSHVARHGLDDFEIHLFDKNVKNVCFETLKAISRIFNKLGIESRIYLVRDRKLSITNIYFYIHRHITHALDVEEVALPLHGVSSLNGTLKRVSLPEH